MTIRIHIHAARPSVGARASGRRLHVLPFLDFGNCAPLTDAAVQQRGLSEQEKQTLEKLKRMTSAPDLALIQDIAKSFAAPKRPYARPDFVPIWFPDRQDDSAQPQCFACGLHLLLFKDDLIQINWGVKDKFMLI